MTDLTFPGKYGDEVLDYDVDWATSRLAVGETIVGDVEVTVLGGVASEGVTFVGGVPTVTASTSLEVENVSTVDGVTTIWISGGGTAANGTTRVNLLATTSTGRSIGVSVALPILGR